MTARNPDADVLYLSVGDPAGAVDFGDTADGHALRYDASSELVGVTIVGVRRLVDEDHGVRIEAPITLRADQLAQLVD
ncbi:MAG TPA: hypothetical protein VLA79_15375 [Polyangia bacterium]|nr:hypothetical protein [Polyangia bacterium]